MAFKLPRLPRDIELVDKTGRPSIRFQTWWQSVVQAIEAQEAAQAAILEQLQDQLAQILAAQAAAAAAQATATSANNRALGIQEAASITFGAVDPSFQTIFDTNAPPP